ncbi:MAG: NlpC/P60 family protein [Thermonemataceae bacterium]
MRAQPSDKSEMTNQLLFGEAFTILDSSQDHKWLHIQTNHDQYVGWIDALQAFPVEEPYWQHYQKQNTWQVTQPSTPLQFKGKYFHITKGSLLPFFDTTTEQGMIAEEPYHCVREAAHEILPKEHIIEQAHQYLGAPYLWGGRSIWGIDCSGFVQQVFRTVGCQLYRDAHQQATQGELVQDLSKARPTDLAFFERDGRIVHVGIILEDQKIIHARGSVRIDRLDTKGILDETSHTYSHQLTLIKRVCSI